MLVDIPWFSCHNTHVVVQRKLVSQFCPFHIWVLENELRSSNLTVRVLSHWSPWDCFSWGLGSCNVSCSLALNSLYSQEWSFTLLLLPPSPRFWDYWNRQLDPVTMFLRVWAMWTLSWLLLSASRWWWRLYQLVLTWSHLAYSSLLSIVETFDLIMAETGEPRVALTLQAKRSGKGHMAHPKAALHVISGHFPEVGTDISGAQYWKTWVIVLQTDMTRWETDIMLVLRNVCIYQTKVWFSVWECNIWGTARCVRIMACLMKGRTSLSFSAYVNICVRWSAPALSLCL